MYNGFLFQGLTWENGLMWIGVTLGLIVVNELTRSHKWVALMMFVVLPLVLPFVLWLPHTAAPGSGASTGTWFHWVKVYSALAGCLGFMLIRYKEKIAAKRWVLLFPPLILSINILEACIRDFQVYGMHAAGEVIDGVVMLSGPWNIMNGIAGLLNIVALTGWSGIYVTKDKTRDMIWPGMKWWWIIAYDLWNFAYVYNCVSDHSFYAGAALLVSCTIPAFFIKRGAWLQHRAHTLAVWMMFTMSVPMFVESPRWGVASSHNPSALLVVSLLSLAANILVVGYQFLNKYQSKHRGRKGGGFNEEEEGGERSVSLPRRREGNPILRSRLFVGLHNLIDIHAYTDVGAATARIKESIPFRGPNVLILVCAIVIASVGLNVNSIPVIIGAMLISPLMGPIIGFGMSLGTNDSRMLLHSLKNLGVMVTISILASTLYFAVTPLRMANPSELLARTRPTIYDVLIAFFGGAAGIIETTRKEHGTVISGVAIATALMPPLCTIGYGVAMLNWRYALGAFYLFCINSIFIALATYFGVRYLHFPKIHYDDPQKERRIRWIMSVVILLVVIPSILTALSVIKQNR